MKSWDEIAYCHGYSSSLFDDLHWCRKCWVGSEGNICWWCGEEYDTKYEWQLPLRETKAPPAWMNDGTAA